MKVAVKSAAVHRVGQLSGVRTRWILRVDADLIGSGDGRRALQLSAARGAGSHSEAYDLTDVNGRCYEGQLDGPQQRLLISDIRIVLTDTQSSNALPNKLHVEQYYSLILKIGKEPEKHRWLTERPRRWWGTGWVGKMGYRLVSRKAEWTVLKDWSKGRQWA